jgi:uncharacterized membrane protein YhaH (DUF805 family)
MNFVEAIKSGFNKYVTFSGRAARSEYWYWTLFAIIADIVAAIIDAFVALGFVGLVVSLALLLPSIAVAIRRPHDLDRTGWWLLLAFTGIGAIVLLVWDCMKAPQDRFASAPIRSGPDADLQPARMSLIASSLPNR